jgi:hypothetical protein
MDTPTGDLVAPGLRFSDQQVWMWQGENLIHFTGSRAVTSYPPVVTGSITNGKLNLTFGSPASDDLCANFFTEREVESVSPTSAKALELFLQANDTCLNFFNDTGTWENGSNEWIEFIYVDMDCTVTIPEYSDSDGGWTFTRPKAILQFKKGWNMLLYKNSWTDDGMTNERTYVISIVNALPAGKWVIGED